MSKTYKIVLTVLSMLISWFLCGFGFTTKLGHPISSICFLTGIGLFFLGLVQFVRCLKKID